MFKSICSFSSLEDHGMRLQIRRGLYCLFALTAFASLVVACTDAPTDPLTQQTTSLSLKRSMYELDPVTITACSPPLEGSYPDCFMPNAPTCAYGGDYPNCEEDPTLGPCDLDYYSEGCPGYATGGGVILPPGGASPSDYDLDHVCDQSLAAPAFWMTLLGADQASWDRLTCAERRLAYRYPWAAYNADAAAKKATRDAAFR
jgi:hypothetical protein